MEAGDGTPQERLARLFTAVATWLEAGEYAGCPYLNMAVEIESGGQPSAAVTEYLDEIGAYLEGLAAAADHPDPAAAGRRLQTILAGSIALGVAHRTSRYIQGAADIAQAVLRPQGGSPKA